MTCGKATRHAQRGSFMIVVMVAVLMLGGVAFALITRLEGETRDINRQETILLALELAEMGLLRGELELASGLDPDGDGRGTLQGLHGGGSYEVEATRSTADRRRWTLESIGSHGLSVRRVMAVVELTGGSRFEQAAFGRTSVTLQASACTDAYDSSQGSYAAQATSSDACGPFALVGGHVASNGSIALQGGSSTVRGDATPGPGQSVSVTAPAVVTGSTTAAGEPVVYDPLPDDRFSAALATNGNLTLDVSSANITYDHALKTMEVKSGGQLVLPAGTYFFSSLTLQGGGSVRLTGPVEIYITHAMDLSGGSIVNDSSRPGDFIVYGKALPLPMVSSKAPVLRSSGGSVARMAIYAPDMDIEIWGGSALQGAVVGENVTIQVNASLHYDVSLQELQHGPATTKRLFWLEPSPPQN